MSITGGSPALLYTSMGTSAVSSIATAYSQSQAIKSAGRYQSSIADTNAKMAEQGDLEASKENLKTQQTVGAIKAQQGASGVSVGSGSAALVRGGANLVGAVDEATIRNNAARKAWGYKIQGIQDTFESRFAKMTAASQSMQTLISGGLSAIQGPLGIYSNYMYMSKRLLGTGTNVPYPGAGK